ncbi:hypothetical protein TWF694_008853 [Orbilia ellipsospora]|uniref:Glycoside hydrolase family 15 protein n=1 Tax=Orbilia ellipsospora TaxID=2528407 RepID=A0AAV9XD47_9PEZI
MSKDRNNALGLRSQTGYLPIEAYGLIGNMHTCALVGIDGGIDQMCWPEFDSPSIFARVLDCHRGGHFSISPSYDADKAAQEQYSPPTTKQAYLPSNNILQTRFLHEDGVVSLLDFFHRPIKDKVLQRGEGNGLKKWLIRRAECIRGEMELDVECFPAFDYARLPHTTEIVKATEGTCVTKILFRTEKEDIAMQLEATIDSEEGRECPVINFKVEERPPHLGPGVTCKVKLREGQSISFVLRCANDAAKDATAISTELLDGLQKETSTYWYNWISQSKYKGLYREAVQRSLMILKLLTYEPTGAIVAAATFSFPEDIGGGRNWDYRFSWVRDSSFTIYILLRMGFTAEAEAYMNFISDRLKFSRNKDAGLPIMFSIRGDTELEELELPHLEGYRGSKPVRIGNGAADHLQLDIYGELMDGIYLYNKFGKPIGWDLWVSVRSMVDYVCMVWKSKDMSIWEVRSRQQDYTYSKIMLWVAVDRGLRLAEKRCLPCPNRNNWMKVRDEIYETVMVKGWNEEKQFFCQSFESKAVLDSAILIAPLVFFIAPNDPRFLSTIDQILRPPEKGGLTEAGLVYRYNTELAEDGVGGREGSFSMCTFWLVEALTRAGRYDKKYLVRAITIFENMLSFSNHLSMFSEEIARSGEQLGNTPQAFSHLAMISAAFNLSRIQSGNFDGM